METMSWFSCIIAAKYFGCRESCSGSRISGSAGAESGPIPRSAGTDPDLRPRSVLEILTGVVCDLGFDGVDNTTVSLIRSGVFVSRIAIWSRDPKFSLVAISSAKTHSRCGWFNRVKNKTRRMKTRRNPIRL